MAEAPLNDLMPDRWYNVQIRSVGRNSAGASETSSWSNVFVFKTSKDTTAPAPVGNLSWAATGTSFVATWTKPAANTDGTPFLDLKEYEVTLKSGSSFDYKFKVNTERFELTLEQNKAMWGNKKPRASINISVVAVDTSDNKSAPATALAVNNPPAPPANVSAVAVLGGISLTWDANTTDTDLDRYRIYGSTDGANFVVMDDYAIWEGTSTAYTYQTLNISPWWFEVQCIDVMEASAGTRVGPVTPIDPFYIDQQPPSLVTNFRMTATDIDETGTAAYITVAWNANTDDDLAGYQISYSTTAGGIPSYVTVGADDTSATIRGLIPGQSYYLKIKAFDFDGNYTLPVATNPAASVAKVDTGAPATPQGFTVIVGLTNATAFWNENAEKDVAGGEGSYEVQYTQVGTFASGVTSIVTRGRVASMSGLETGKTYYFRLRAIDRAGNPSTWTAPQSFVMGASYAGKIGGDIIAGSTLAGGAVIAGTLDADRLKANSAFINNLSVQSVFTINATGQIKSSNYDGSNGFSLTSAGLDIRSGTVAAKALQIQTPSNILPAEYASMEFVSATGRISSAAGVNPVVDTAQKKFGNQSLKFSTFAGSWVYLGTDTAYSAANTAIGEPGVYILSWYAYASGNVVMAPVLRSIVNGRNYIGSGQTVSTAGWTRYWATFTLAADDTGVSVYFDTSGGGTGWIDGVQLERQQGSLTTPSPWTQGGITSIDGGMIRTGSLASTTGAWTINMNGNATFANARINGILVVENNSGYNIQSGNAVGGSAGWHIRGDGYAEFMNVRVRGNITGSSGDFNGSLTVNNKFFVNTNGDMWIGHTDFWSAPFKVTAAGALYATGATISGAITANSVDTPYLDIDSNGNLTGTNFSVGAGGTLWAVGANLRGSLQVGDANNAGSGYNIWLNGNGIYAGAESGDPWSAPFWVQNNGTLIANAGNFTGSIKSTSTIEGASMTAGRFTTDYSWQFRAEMGSGIYGWNGWPSVKFYSPNSSEWSGIEGDSTRMWIHANTWNGTGRKVQIGMDSYAGIAGQMNFVIGSSTKATFTWDGLNFASDSAINMGLGLGQRIHMYGTSYGFGIANNSMYYRVQAGGAHYWFEGGSHSNGQGDPGGGNVRMRLMENGQLYTSTGTIASSSIRYKTNVENLTPALDLINRLRPVTFNRVDIETDKLRSGFIAEEIVNEIPEIVGYDEQGEVEGLDYSGFSPYIIKAMQELTERVKYLEFQLTRK